MNLTVRHEELMVGERIIDLDEEFLSLFKKEEMFAFFDFNLTLPGEQTASGLCKISRPRSADPDLYYISLLFMIDVADDTVCQGVDEYINKINWKDLNAYVPEIVSVLPIPHLVSRSGIYFREIAIYLTGDKLTSSFFSRLHPLLCRVAGFRSATPIFWDDMPQVEMPISSKDEPPPTRRVAWYISRLKDLFD